MHAYAVIPNRSIKSHPPLALCRQHKKTITIATYPSQFASFVKLQSRKQKFQFTYVICVVNTLFSANSLLKEESRIILRPSSL